MTPTGTAQSFRVFHRTWWRRNPAWPSGREPGTGRKTTIANPGPLSRKAEFEAM